MRFPDGPRLELDQLLAQLIDRARDVMVTQGRLRGLLRANQLIVGDLELPAVLSRIADAARELIGARYAALGVIGGDQHLAEFVHSGMDRAAVAAIGHLPEGKGLLGAVIDDRAPIRLSDMTADPRSSGFPPGHPPMKGFLGVPIRIREEVFGNLYLADSTGGGFTVEDEELATALAASAAVAIENARLYQAARTRQRWLQATAAISQQLLSADSGDGAASLRLIAEHARTIADADLVTVLLPSGEKDSLTVAVARGADSGTVENRTVPVSASLAGRVFTTRMPLLSAATGEHPHVVTELWRELNLGPSMVLPLLGSARVWGVLSVARYTSRQVFSPEELDMASSFAAQAAVALELAEARAEQQRAAMLDERDRIAADLHDLVIQRLFAAGLSLQSVLGRVGPGPVSDRIKETIRNLDETTSQIRTTIFQLHDTAGTDPDGARSRLLRVVTEIADVLGFTPSLRFSGPLEEVLDRDLVEDLLAVVREALSNIARHAHARSAEIDIAVDGAGLAVVVSDDGRGISAANTRSSGLSNLRERARRHGGTCDVVARRPRGTTLTWTIPTPLDPL